jgi:hypothetical protein
MANDFRAFTSHFTLSNFTASPDPVSSLVIKLSQPGDERAVVFNMVLTSNSPSAGNVAWSDCTVYWNGNQYDIPAGNTTSSHAFVYWTQNSYTFTEAASYTNSATTFMMFKNISGVGVPAWNRQIF